MAHVENDLMSDAVATKNIQKELIVLDGQNLCIFLIFLIFPCCGVESSPKWW